MTTSRFDHRFESKMASIDALFNHGNLPFDQRTAESTLSIACST